MNVSLYLTLIVCSYCMKLLHLEITNQIQNMTPVDIQVLLHVYFLFQEEMLNILSACKY